VADVPDEFFRLLFALKVLNLFRSLRPGVTFPNVSHFHVED